MQEPALCTIMPHTAAHAALPAPSHIWAPDAAVQVPKAPNHDPSRTLLHAANLLIPPHEYCP